MKKIPPDAFQYYASLGPGRSYEAVADHYGVTKRAITRRATTEGWQEHMQSIESRARERAEEKYVETLEAVNTRHLQTLRIIQAKALQALKEGSPDVFG
jgi:transposase